MSRIVIMGAPAAMLANFRGDLVKFLVDSGHQVLCLAPEDDPLAAAQLEANGARYRALPFRRNGISPLGDLRFYRQLRDLLKEEKPDIFLATTIKPVVYGIPAARAAGVPRAIALVTGLGYTFIGAGFKAKLIGFAARLLYRNACAQADRVIFQNPDDRGVFVEAKLVRPEITALVAGSGVHLSRFPQSPLPEGPPLVLCVARLLKEKGVREFAEAAALLKPQFPSARFVIVGPEDSGPSGHRRSDIEAWSGGTCEAVGPSQEVGKWLAESRLFVLPSWREGTSRAALEALACGRPIVTTDAPGCRETVRPGINGELVPLRDPQALAAAIASLLSEPERCRRYAEASRSFAEERFDVAKVNAEMLRLLER
ncbi:MAG: hypothetical protein RL095_1661 [Verrucomicrobiota bacterium]|jgi:glycosyltransferase involved in cell wall biosynthesis